MLQKKALVISTQYYSSPFKTGSRHFTDYLLNKNYEVVHIAAPLSPLHLINLGNRLTRHRFQVFFQKNKKNSGLYSHIPFALFVPAYLPFLRKKFVFYYWHRFSVPNIVKKITRKHGTFFNLIFIDSIFQPFWTRYLKSENTVFRITDDFRGFPGWRPYHQDIVNNISANADLIIYPSEFLSDYVETLPGMNKLMVSNGVSKYYFEKKEIRKPSIFDKMKPPVIIYLGSMEKWFDQELMIKTAEKIPYCSFLLIGPKSKHIKALLKQSNVFHIESIQPGEIKDYLKAANVALIPFNARDYKTLISPLAPIKLFEYLACGVPVVTTYWKNLDYLKAPVYVSKNHDSFIKNILKALNNPTDSKTLISYATKFNQTQIFDKMMNKLNSGYFLF